MEDKFTITRTTNFINAIHFHINMYSIGRLPEDSIRILAHIRRLG